MNKIWMLFLLISLFSCKNNDFQPAFSTGVVNRDDVKIFSNSDVSSENIYTLSLCDVVIINKGRIIKGKVRDEEIIHNGKPLKIKVQEDSKKWLNINYKDIKGWILIENVFYLEDQVINEIIQSESENKYPLFNKYSVADDPYNKQFILFINKKEADVVTNFCEGFGKGKKQYYVYKNYIFFPENDLILKYINKRELILYWGAESYTCNNVENGRKMILK